ncbi:MAG TPA: prepilin-type N-terminal cleavage/methylation domain-containing protein [bacterium]|nr:prepilin-type N-terminal cleavage/methylation domain-containing protein [bacterium]HPT29799.1 prepilin-type N-terminal cleavage/methylation domain-containing protein [bacterium]
MKIKARQSAFTLLEMILVLSVIAIISGLFWANYYGGEKRSQVINAQKELIRQLRLAQTYSLSGKQYNNNLPLGGWGLHVNQASTTYLFFADVNGNQVYDTGEANVTAGGRVGTWPAGITISSSTPADILDITFRGQTSPWANIYDGAATSSEATITFYEGENSSTAMVRINEGGLISDR